MKRIMKIIALLILGFVFIQASCSNNEQTTDPTCEEKLTIFQKQLDAVTVQCNDKIAKSNKEISTAKETILTLQTELEKALNQPISDTECDDRLFRRERKIKMLEEDLAAGAQVLVICRNDLNSVSNQLKVMAVDMESLRGELLRLEKQELVWGVRKRELELLYNQQLDLYSQWKKDNLPGSGATPCAQNLAGYYDDFLNLLKSKID